MVLKISADRPLKAFPLNLWDGPPARPLYFLWDGRPARPVYLLALPHILSISCSIDPDRP